MNSLQRLADIANEYGRPPGKHGLSSGGETDTYFEGEMVTLLQDGQRIIVEILLNIISPYLIQAIGGPTLGAVSIVSATVYRFGIDSCPINGFFVRSEKKKHGTKKQFEGYLPENERVAIFDDTITTGNSILRAIEVVGDYGCEVAIIVALLDRQEGGLERIRDAGYDAVALLKMEPDGNIIPADI